MRAPSAFVALLGLVLGGCASQPPEALRGVAAGAPTLQEVRQSPERYVGSRVRWGGTIVDVSHRNDGTWIELVGRRLDDQWRPEPGDRSAGRFLAYFDAFLEPEVYRAGRELTVVGVLGDPVQGRIGELDYQFPLVRASAHHLWPKRATVDRRYAPYGYYYDPWYPHPYGPWGWRPYYW